MAEPQVQYAKTSDGVNIAYCTLGEGTPFIQMASVFSHLQLEWHHPGFRAWYERLAEKRMLVRYDGRGTGLSERDVTDFSLDTRVRDVEAVVEHLGFDTFALWGTSDWGPVAIAYAVSHPERVSHLILWCTYASTSDPAWAKTLDDLIMTDWEMATETITRGYLGRAEEEEAHRLAALGRESITPEAMVAITRAADQFDVTDLLGRVRSPTLVMHRRQMQFTEISSARNLASRIPNARLVVLEGETPMPFMGDTDAVLQAIDEFLSEGDEVAGAPGLAADDVHTILFTDMEGSTALTERLGDTKARDLLREHERITREALKAHGGSEVKTMGDGFMASFSSATKALECAITMQRSFAGHNEAADERINVRIGLNAGEPIAEDQDLFGTTVNMAARICSKADGGQILAPIVVRELVAGKEFLFADLGETEMRGFEDPVRLYEVRWREDD